MAPTASKMKIVWALALLVATLSPQVAARGSLPSRKALLQALMRKSRKAQSEQKTLKAAAQHAHRYMRGDPSLLPRRLHGHDPSYECMCSSCMCDGCGCHAESGPPFSSDCWSCCTTHAGDPHCGDAGGPGPTFAPTFAPSPEPSPVPSHTPTKAPTFCTGHGHDPTWQCDCSGCADPALDITYCVGETSPYSCLCHMCCESMTTCDDPYCDGCGAPTPAPTKAPTATTTPAPSPFPTTDVGHGHDPALQCDCDTCDFGGVDDCHGETGPPYSAPCFECCSAMAADCAFHGGGPWCDGCGAPAPAPTRVPTTHVGHGHNPALQCDCGACDSGGFGDCLSRRNRPPLFHSLL